MKTNRCISCQNEIEQYPCPHCGFDAAAYQQPEYALPCGYILHGRYLIGKVLGQGGFGITYVGWDLSLQVKCAIKEYFPNSQVTRSPSGAVLDWYTTPQADQLRRNGLQTFLKEARKMAKTADIPQVVSVRDTFAENETAYIVMDYVEGQTLKSRLEQSGVLSWEEAKEIFFPVISAMAQVHQAGLVHRDLSPDNLMLLPNGDVKILDLGAAKDLTVNQGLSSMQVVKGGFSPIEQYGQSGGSGPWTDVYAMAATMYYSLTGKLPPVAVDRLTEDPLSWDLPQLQKLPRRVLDAMQKAMVVLAKDRTQNMSELLEQMRSSTRRKKSNAKKSKKQKSKAIPVIAAVAVLALLGGGIFMLRSTSIGDQLTVPAPEWDAPDIPAEPVEPDHIHTWAPATAGRPARCEQCGWMWGTALNVSLSADETIVGLRRDGTVLAQGNENMVTAVSGWQDVASVKAAYQHVYGIKQDGTVVSASASDVGIMKWSDIMKIDSERAHAAGLRKDGTVVTASYIENTGTAHLNTEAWTNIVDVAAGYAGGCAYTVGLKVSGRLVIAAEEPIFQETKQWTDIVSIADCGSILFGLKADGTVISAVSHKDFYDKAWEPVLEQIASWREIAQIDCGSWGIVGLKNDGTVVMECPAAPQRVNQIDVSDWTDISFVCIGDDVYGLKSNGTVVMKHIKADQAQPKDVSFWTGIKKPDGQLIPEDPNAEEHIHTWVDASITAPRHCSGCGEMEGIPLGNPIAAGVSRSYALQNSWNSGTITCTGYNGSGALNVSTWINVKALAAGDGVLGLKEDGTVAVAGNYGAYGMDMVSRWTDIVSIAAGGWNLFGVKSDGTVVGEGQWNLRRVVSHWTDVVSISTSSAHSVALRRDGTVVSMGNDDLGQCSGVQEWTGMVGVAAGEGFTLGLRYDGTVAAIWNNAEGKAAVESWTDIIALAASDDYVLGLKADGTVVAAGSNEDCQYPVDTWTDIVAIDVSDHVLGLKSDGTVVAGGQWMQGQGGVEGTEDWGGVPMPR